MKYFSPLFWFDPQTSASLDSRRQTASKVLFWIEMSLLGSGHFKEQNCCCFFTPLKARSQAVGTCGTEISLPASFPKDHAGSYYLEAVLQQFLNEYPQFPADEQILQCWIHFNFMELTRDQPRFCFKMYTVPAIRKWPQKSLEFQFPNVIFSL